MPTRQAPWPASNDTTYLPFGEELYAGTGNRTLTNGYSGDNFRQKFTSKERDIETGLDYFGARYYASTQGRFTSPDEFSGGPDEFWVLGNGDEQKQALPYADIFQPQSLNKYQYAYNNPLRYVDPDGHDIWEVLKATGQGLVGAGKEVANIVMEGTPLVAAPNGISRLLTGKRLIGEFEAANDAQSVGMTTVAVAAIIVPGPAGKIRALTKLSKVPKAMRAPPLTRKQRAAVHTKTKEKNAGDLICDDCGTSMVPAQKSQKGVTPKSNEATVDHVDPVSKGGSNDPTNLRSTCRKCNRDKSDND